MLTGWLAAALAAALMGLLGLAATADAAPAAPVAAAAPSADPSCPASLRAVSGGARDAEAGGRDDGEAGPDADYEPGQVLVRLNAGVPRAAFDCVLRELDAGLIDGGPGAAGLGHLPGLMLVQLAPGKSVRKTVRLLNSPAYRDLVNVAEANEHLETMDPPDDPLWNRQWGFDIGSGVPAPAGGNATDQPADQVALDPRKTALPESMRLTQAWEMMRARQPRWFRQTVQVAFIDDSLFEHEDLVRNTSTTQSRIQMPTGFNEQRVELRARARGAFSLQTGAGGANSCPVQAGAEVGAVASLLGRLIPAFCDRIGPDLHAVMLTIGGDTGTLALNDGTNGVARINVAKVWEDDAQLRLDAATTRSVQLGRQLSAEESMFKRLFGTNLTLGALAADDACRPEDKCLRFAIVYESRDLQPTINRDNTNVTKAVVTNGRTYYLPAPVSLNALTARVQSARTVEKGRILDVKWKGPALAGLVTEWKDTSLVAPAADVVEKVTALGDYTPERNAATPQWPGRASEDADHGQAVAGLLAGTVNNGIGIAGVPGPNIKLKVTGVVTPLTSSALVTAIDYAARVVGAKVVNMSIGNEYDDDDVPPDLIDASKEDPRPPSTVQQAMAQRPETLFVLAAGNEATDHRRPGLRHGRKYNGKGASDGFCSPRGMGRTKWWGAAGSDSFRTAAKGGAYSKLRMPDDTFDRGNILCVAAMAAPPVPRAGDPTARRLAEFSSWGRDFVDVAAPGENIVTTGANNQYRVVNGTSFAAPIVAGVAAMVFWMNPGIDVSRVKCAIMSSATTAPLDPLDPNAMPFDYHPNFGDPPLTVNGMVVASEALSAAAALNGKRGRSRGGGFVDYKEPRATCVQRRAVRVWNAQANRWDTSGGWVNANRNDLQGLSSAAPPPAPVQNEKP